VRGGFGTLAFALAAALTSILTACGPSYPTPFTAEEMAQRGTGAALVHYLGQPGATAAVCDRRNPGPRFLGANAKDLEDLTDGLRAGDVRPELWARCGALMIETMRPNEAVSLVDALLRAYRPYLRDQDIEQNGPERTRLLALHRVFLLRPTGVAPSAPGSKGELDDLRAELADHRYGAFGTKLASEVLSTLDLDRGTWQGAKVTTAMIDAQTDEELLRQMARRLPDRTVADSARRRIIRLHIASSRSPDVEAHAAEVETVVMATGRNAVRVGEHAATRAWIDADRLHVSGVLVRQNLSQQTVQLLAYRGAQRSGTILPSLDLAAAFHANFAGLHDPVSLCELPDALDVAPCLAPEDLKPTLPIVYLDPEGLLHFVERIAMKDALALVYQTPNLPIGFAIGGQEAFGMELPITFSAPEPLVYRGRPAGRGPDLSVVLQRRYAPRVLFEVHGPDGVITGAVETADLPSFAIATLGGDGVPGTRGTDGANGSDGASGSPGSCPGSPGGNGGNGTSGGNGTAGGPGGPGGDGGDVTVRVSCVTGECQSLGTLATQLVQTRGGQGGAGGQGGRGGRGGQGGSGGSGASCTDSQGHSTSVSGGSQGSNGSDGFSGADGPDGASGHSGRQVVHGAGP
jgi:hypothetical protein